MHYMFCDTECCTFSQPLRLAGAGLQPCGCQSLDDGSAWFQGFSFGSFLAFVFDCVGAASVGAGTGGSRGISCSFDTALPSIASLAFIWATALVGSCDCSGCMGCCRSGASSADGFDAQRWSACKASTFILSWRATSCLCSSSEGGSKRVWRSHCIHDAATVRKAPARGWEGTNEIL